MDKAIEAKIKKLAEAKQWDELKAYLVEVLGAAAEAGAAEDNARPTATELLALVVASAEVENEALAPEYARTKAILEELDELDKLERQMDDDVKQMKVREMLQGDEK